MPSGRPVTSVFSTGIGWVFLVALTALGLMSCQAESDLHEGGLVNITDSPTIDSLLVVAPHVIVDMDGLEQEAWVSDMEMGLPHDTLALGRAAAVTAVRDSLYVADGQAEAVFSVGGDGYLQTQIGRQGEGPVEFHGLADIHYNGDYIFTYERRHRIQVLTEAFELVETLLVSQSGNIAVSSSDLFAPCRWDSLWLVCLRSASPPFSWREGGLLPAIDFPDRSGERTYRISASPNGALVATGYAGLPYIFIHDRALQHIQTIGFKGAYVRDFDPVATSPGVPVAGTRVFLQGLYFLGNSHLAAVTVVGTYVIALSENGYRHVKSLMFLRPDGSSHRIETGVSDRGIRVDYLFLHDGHLYVSGFREEHIYRYPFKL